MLPETLPAFMARLERTAADRYRLWATAFEGHRDGLLECAAREDEIADRIEDIYPATTAEQVASLDSAVGPAKDAYNSVFSTLTPMEQMAIQASAERQGAAAWRGMISDASPEDLRAGLEYCAELEEISSAFLRGILAR